MMRSETYRRLVAALPCVKCGAPAPSQAAHSNLQCHGKGMGIKASDAATFPMCVPCHTEFDQGKTLSKEERRQSTHEWIASTFIKLANAGKLSFKG